MLCVQAKHMRHSQLVYNVQLTLFDSFQ